VSETAFEDDFDDELDEVEAKPARHEPAPSATQEALRAQLVEQRDDIALWTVYGDLLQSEDDPRGALVMVMLERERAPSQKLYDAELAYRTQHVKRLLPRALRRYANDVAWRRGFPVGIPVPSLGALSQLIGVPSLLFVEAARIVVSAEEWPDFIAALEGVQLPWRRVRIEMLNGSEDDDELELAPVLASFPMLEHLTLVCRPQERARLGFGDAAAPRLRVLVIDNASETVRLEEADFPVLEELRCLGTLPVGGLVFESELWKRLRRVVATAADEVAEGPEVVSHVREERDEFDYDPTNEEAFVAIRQLVDPSVIEEAAASLRGFYALAVDTGHHIAGDDSFTVFRMRGGGPTDLLPYGLASTIATRLAPSTPVALYHSSERTGTARGFTLGTPPMRRSTGGGANIIRALFDQQVGRDPGIDLLDDLVEALECARTTQLVGTAGSSNVVLTDIDPGSLGPLPEVDEDFEEPVPEHEVERYTQPAHAAVIEEPEAIEASSLADAVVEIEQELADDAEATDDSISEDTGEISLRTDGSPDGRDAWMRVLSTWADRERDPDDEYAERFPDPEVLDSEDIDFDSVPANHSQCQDCASERIVVYACVWCGGHHCANCSIKPESGGVWCNQCVIDLAKARTGDDLGAKAYDDDVYDAEVAEDRAEVRVEQLRTRPDIDDDEWA